MMHAQLSDGTILEFPDGTPDNIIDNTVQSYIAPSNPILHGMGVAGAAAIRGIPAVPLGIIDTTDRIVPWAANLISDTKIPYPTSFNAAYQGFVNKNFNLPSPRNAVENYINAVGMGAAGGGTVAGLPGAIAGVGAGIGGQIGHDLPLSEKNISIMGKDIGVSPQDIASTTGGLIGGGIASPKQYIMPKSAGSNQARLAQILMNNDVPVYLKDILPENSTLKSAIGLVEDLPFSGASTKYAERQNALNNAVASQMGTNAKDVSAPNMERASNIIGDTYDMFGKNYDISPQHTYNLVKALGDIETKSLGVDPQAQTAISSQINNNIMPKLSSSGMSGEAYNSVRSDLSRMGRNSNPDISNAGYEIRSALDNAMKNSMPQDLANALMENNSNYRNMIALEQAAKKGIVTGNVDPQALQSGVSRIFPNYEYNDLNSLPQLTQGAQLLKSDSASPVLDLKRAGFLGEAAQAGLYASSPILGFLRASNFLNPQLSAKDFAMTKSQALSNALNSMGINQASQGGQ